jgi:hypothetical protein
VPALRAALCSLTIAAIAVVSATPALAAGEEVVSGGTTAAEPTPSTTTSGGATTTAASGGASTTTGGSTTTTKPVHKAPVTARTSNIKYKGPVYERTAEGQIVPYVTPPPTGKASGSTGGSSAEVQTSTKPDLLVPGATARYVDGLAAAPMSAPAVVQEIIWAGNQIIGLPYIYGGGHASFVSPGYDCSGTVSFALHGASLLTTPMDSSEFMGWGQQGDGQWVTVFANPEHAYMTVAGLRLDTSAVDDPTNQQGPRWRPLRQENIGYKVRHPVGL